MLVYSRDVSIGIYFKYSVGNGRVKPSDLIDVERSGKIGDAVGLVKMLNVIMTFEDCKIPNT